MSEFIYQTNNLSKYYGKFKALDDVNLNLGSGRIIGLLGKNGAGKSTLMRCLLGFLNHEGSVKLGEREIKHRDHRVFEEVAFIPDVSGLDDRLTSPSARSFSTPSWASSSTRARPSSSPPIRRRRWRTCCRK